MDQSLLTRLVYKIASVMTDRPMAAATEDERHAADKLRADLDRLSAAADMSSVTHEAWTAYAERLAHLVRAEDPRSFLRWDVVQKTMVVANCRYVHTELKWLWRRPDWDTKWSKALVDPHVGHPRPFPWCRKASANTIHHAYHLAQFEDKTFVDPAKMDFVFEFGGGYGSMCRLLRDLGFRGTYVVFDLPAFSAIQRYYLRATGTSQSDLESLRRRGSGVICTDDWEELRQAIDCAKNAGRSLFLATWSLSESPIATRESLLPLISLFDNYLLAYQNSAFGELDNDDYFRAMEERELFRDVRWEKWEIPHLPGNHYMVGTRTAPLA